MLGFAKHEMSVSKSVVSNVFVGTQLGEIIIHSEDHWVNSANEPVFSLLEQNGQTFDELLYPELYALLGTNVLEDIPNATGSEVPFKRVADYQGAING